MFPAGGAVVLHASRREKRQVMVTGTLFGMATFVAYMRWWVIPQ
jgi:hypothetical protein